MDGLEVPFFTHDRVFRESLQKKEVACDFFRAHLPAKILNQIQLDTLQALPRSFISQGLQEQESDVLYQVLTTDQKPCYLYLLIEHQSSPSYWMPLRLLEYSLGIWNQHLEKYPQDRLLPPLFPLVYYHGEVSPYPHPLRLLDLFRYPEWVEEFFLKATPLVDLSKLTFEDMKAHPLVALLEWTQKYIRRTSLPEFITGFFDLLKQVNQDPSLVQESVETYKQRIFFYLFSHFPKEKWEDMQYQLQRETLTQEEQKMISAAQALMEQGFTQGRSKGLSEGRSKGLSEGRSKGLSEGLSQGRSQGHREVAQKMFQKGLTLIQIAEFTGLSVPEIEQFLTSDEASKQSPSPIDLISV